MNESRIAYLNGTFIPEEQASVSIFDRAFLYGDGLFATLRISHGQPFRWRRHWLRLHRGAEFLKLELPVPDTKLREMAVELARLNRISEGVLRVTVSRGCGKRGYSPAGATLPTVTMIIEALPSRTRENPLLWRLATSGFKLQSSDPLACFKSCNRLLQVIARAHAEAAGFDEALLVNERGDAVESTSGNLFWIQGDEICTPPLGTGIFPGVTRSVLFEVAESLGSRVNETNVPAEELARVAGVFLSMSSFGVVEVSHIDDHELARSEWVKTLRVELEKLVQSETSRDSQSSGRFSG